MEPSPEDWKKIEDILRCPVCHDMLHDAKFLPCGHTFCQSCLELCQRHKPSKIGMSCPMCKENSYISSFRHMRAGFSDLPKNLIAQEVADVVRRRNGDENTEEDPVISNLFPAAPAPESRPRPGRHVQVLRRMRGWFRTLFACFCGITLFLSAIQEQDVQEISATALIICRKIIPPDPPVKEIWNITAFFNQLSEELFGPKIEEKKTETFLETVKRRLKETTKELCGEVEEYRRSRKDLYRRWIRAMDER